MPGEITVNLINKAMHKNGWSTQKFLIDGFPRSDENYKGWCDIMGDSVDMKFVIFLECSEDKMIERIMKRSAESEVKRNDDNLDVLKKRFNTFREQSMPIVEIYRKEGKVKVIDANQGPESVYAQVKEALKEVL